MVSSRRSDTANLPLVYPLFDRWEADAKFQGCFARFQKLFIRRLTSLRLWLPGHLEPNPTVEKQLRSTGPAARFADAIIL